jgi:hypothetical protein
MAAGRQTGRGRGIVGVAGAAVAISGALALAPTAISKFDLRQIAYLLLVLALASIGLFAQRITSLAHRMQREQAAEAALVRWPASPTAEVNVFDVGVFPPISGTSNPRYIERDVDHRLVIALQSTALVLLHGPARCGKSRTALEVLKSNKPEALLLAPESAERLANLTDEAPELKVGDGGAVLWLDGLERFLEGLRINALDTLVAPNARLQVLATINEDVGRSLLKGNDQTASTLRRFVARARLIELQATLSESELARAGNIPEYGEYDLTDGFAVAFAMAWDMPVTLGEPVETSQRQSHLPSVVSTVRRIFYDKIALAILAFFLVVVGWTLYLGWTEGLQKPPPIAVQLAALHRRLSSCGIQLFSTNSSEDIEHGEPLLVATDPALTCAGRRSGDKPVFVYGLSHGDLKQVYAFGPPPELLPDHFSFECHGPNKADRCWTDITGEQNFALAGGFRSVASHLTFPVAVSETNGTFEARPLLTDHLPLSKQFRAKAYDKASALVGTTQPGYYTADYALANAPRDDQDVRGVRLVTGFTRIRRPGARHLLQLRATPLSISSGVPVLSPTQRCVPVRRSDREIINVPSGLTFEARLRDAWRGFEQRTPARAICY